MLPPLCADSTRTALQVATGALLLSGHATVPELAITTAVAQTGGPAVSGMIVALAGPGTSLLIDGATFGVSSLTLALIPSVTADRPAGTQEDPRRPP